MHDGTTAGIKYGRNTSNIKLFITLGAFVKK